jgi:hypothetical protein
LHFPFCTCDPGRSGTTCEVLEQTAEYTMAWIVGLGVVLVVGLGCGALYTLLSRRRGNMRVDSHYGHNAFFDPITQQKAKVYEKDWL